MDLKNADIGMIGLGVMGCNLVLNMADHGFSVVGIDRDPSKGQALLEQSGNRSIAVAASPRELVESLRIPRVVMMMVPAGPPVDAVIQQIMPLLSRGDILIDGGNSYFKDTDLRAKTLGEKGILYLGTGISGGEEGARHGPSMMPGGPLDAYQRVQPIFEAISAHMKGDPCVTYLGAGSAGHFVKMVHNGIEYGLMEVIAETYGLLKRALDYSDDQLSAIYKQWNRGQLASFLLEITGEIFMQNDKRTGRRLIDVILDEAGQKGTGKWTSQEAMDLQVATPSIDVAVTMRELSQYKTERELAGKMYPGVSTSQDKTSDHLVEWLPDALFVAFLVTFAQGFAVLQAASKALQYNLNLADVARIWRGGCIIRAALLEQITAAYQEQPGMSNLLLDSAFFQKEILSRLPQLRQVITLATQKGIPVPGLMAALSYLDAYSSAWLPANLIQAQRDYFGAHTYERIDEKGVFHTHWISE